ncbi:hypothetical protein D3C77_430740 [compost metagenome]
MQRQALALEQADVQLLGVVDQGQLALRGQRLDQLREVLVGLGQAGHVGDLIDALRFERLGQRLAVVDDQVSTQLADPVLGLWTGGGADDGEAGQLTGQLSQDRTHATGGADDQQALAQVVSAFSNLQAFKQQLPGGDCGQRQRGGFGKTQALGHMADDALIDDMQFAVAPGTGNGAGVEHLVAWLEQGDITAHRLDHTGHIPAQHLGGTRIRLHVLAHLGIHRVHRDGADLYQQVPRTWLGGRQFDVLQGGRVGDGQGVVVGNGFHDCRPQGEWMDAMIGAFTPG